MFLKIFSFWFLIAAFTSPLFAESDKALTILYTADVLGEDKPSYLCAGKTGGGLARKTIMIGAWRTITPDLLLLDCGGIIPLDNENTKLRSDIILKAMDKLSYDAMNLSGGDFALGESYLESWSRSLSFPLISSNLVSMDGTAPPWMKRYAVIHSGPLSIGVMGVMPEDAFDQIPTFQMPSGMKLVSSLDASGDSPPEPVAKDAVYRRPVFQRPSGLKIIPPMEAVAALLPELIGQVDVIVLLSQLSVEDTAALVRQTEGIDLALSHEKRSESKTEQDGETLVAPCGTTASNIEIIELSVSPAGKASIVKNEPIELDDDIPHDPDMDQLIADAYAERMREIREEQKTKKTQMLHQQIMDGLTMSPEEFMRKMKQERSTDPAAATETIDADKKP